MNGVKLVRVRQLRVRLCSLPELDCRVLEGHRIYINQRQDRGPDLEDFGDLKGPTILSENNKYY